MRKDITVLDVAKALQKKGYDIFETDSKPYNLNMVGIRSATPVSGKFNDLMVVFWKYEGIWNMIQMQITTLAGLPWMTSPMNPKGCAILKEGQWKGCWSLGMHNGKYKALVQVKPVVVYRDNDKDVEYDMIESSTDEGLFGINIHRSHSKVELMNVGKFSAGCQVVQNPHEYDVFIKLCEEAAEVWGNRFTYTLISENDIS
jgi:hypothetical protein